MKAMFVKLAVALSCVLMFGMSAEAKRIVRFEGGQLVGYTEYVSETGRYPVPPFSIAPFEENLFKVYDIMQNGEGMYVIEVQNVKEKFRLGWPMWTMVREVKTVAEFKDDTWLAPRKEVGPGTHKESLVFTGLLLVSAALFFILNVLFVKKGASDGKLMKYYGCQIPILLLPLGHGFGQNSLSGDIGNILVVAGMAMTGAATISSSLGEVKGIRRNAKDSVITVGIVASVVLWSIAIEIGSQMDMLKIGALVIVGSYLLAKIGQWSGWIKPTPIERYPAVNRRTEF